MACGAPLHLDVDVVGVFCAILLRYPVYEMLYACLTICYNSG